MTLPGYGDTRLAPADCRGGACPHDHPDMCPVCSTEVDFDTGRCPECHGEHR